MKQYIIDRLHSHLVGMEDNLARYKMQFKNCTPSDMDKAYGQSGKTNQQLLNYAVQNVAKAEAAIKYMEER